MIYTDITGLAGNTAALVAAALLMPGAIRLQPMFRALLVVVVAVAALVPWTGLPVAAYVRAVLGDLSITTLVLLVLFMLRKMPDGRPADDRPRLVLHALVVLAALGLYPFALGIGMFDPYRLGYGNAWLVGVLLVLALAACWLRLALPALCIALAVLAWTVGWYESGNLWDYLLDPLLAVYAIGVIIQHGVHRLKTRMRMMPR